MRPGLCLLMLAICLFPGNAVSQQTTDLSSATSGAKAPGATPVAETSLPNEESVITGANPAKADSGNDVLPDDNDQKLAAQILHVLQAYPSLASSSFQVSVSNNEIQLSGSVPTMREKEIARRIAQSYGNNRSVVDTKINVQNAARPQYAQTPPR